MKKQMGVALCAMALLSGCTGEERYKYEGRTDNWDISYVAYVQGEDQMKTDGTLHFIGEGRTPKEIQYYLETPSKGSSGNDIAIQGKIATFEKGSCEGCSVVTGNDAIELTMEWDGEKERVQLKQRK